MRAALLALALLAGGPIIKKIYVVPSAVTLKPGQKHQFCIFAKMSDNTYRMSTQSAAIPYCVTLYKSWVTRRP